MKYIKELKKDYFYFKCIVKTKNDILLFHGHLKDIKEVKKDIELFKNGFNKYIENEDEKILNKEIYGNIIDDITWDYNYSDKIKQLRNLKIKSINFIIKKIETPSNFNLTTKKELNDLYNNLNFKGNFSQINNLIDKIYNSNLHIELKFGFIEKFVDIKEDVEEDLWDNYEELKNDFEFEKGMIVGLDDYLRYYEAKTGKNWKTEDGQEKQEVSKIVKDAFKELNNFPYPLKTEDGYILYEPKK